LQPHAHHQIIDGHRDVDYNDDRRGGGSVYRRHDGDDHFLFHHAQQLEFHELVVAKLLVPKLYVRLEQRLVSVEQQQCERFLQSERDQRLVDDRHRFLQLEHFERHEQLRFVQFHQPEHQLEQQ
jgi:hypothetical protein